MHTPLRTAQRGTSLLEALIAFLVLSLGMIAIARLQGHLRLDADVARQRSEAVRLAQEDMEALRGFATIGAAPGTRSFDAIASGSRSVDGGTSYRIDRQITVGDTPQAKSASITVSWTDRSGSPQQVALHSIIAGSDPALSAALALAPR
jgi:Tfp pilus assembly protein PilV